MSYTVVKKAGVSTDAFLLADGYKYLKLIPSGGHLLLSPGTGSGLSVIVSNTLKDTGGGSQVVSNDALDTGAGTHTIFTATVEVNPVKIINFRLGDSLNRMFRL